MHMFFIFVKVKTKTKKQESQQIPNATLIFQSKIIFFSKTREKRLKNTHSRNEILP